MLAPSGVSVWLPRNVTCGGGGGGGDDDGGESLGWALSGDARPDQNTTIERKREREREREESTLQPGTSTGSLDVCAWPIGTHTHYKTQ